MVPGTSYLPGVGRTLYLRAVLFDSGPFVALAAKSDDRYQAALDCVDEIARRRLPAFVLTATIHEAHRRILHDRGNTRARLFLGAVTDGSVEIIRATEAEDTRALGILDQHPYVPLTLTDALNVAVMLSRGIGTIFSFDDHFLQVGLVRVPPLP